LKLSIFKMVFVFVALMASKTLAQSQDERTQSDSSPSSTPEPPDRRKEEEEKKEEVENKAKTKKLPTAQPGSDKSGSTLSLKESIRRGLEFGIEIAQAKSLLRKAEAQYRVSDSFLFPTVNLVGQAGAQKASAAYSGGFTGSTGESELYRAYLSLRQPLYQGGLVTAGLSANRVQIESAKQRLFDSKQKYAFSVIETYLKASKAQLLLSLSRDNRSILKSYFQVTARYASIGRSKNIDRLTAEASYNLSEAEVLKAESELERGLQDLQQVTGFEVPLDTNLENETPLQPVETGSLDQLYQRAVENNPELRALEMDVDRQKYLNDARLSDHFPRLSLDGTYGYTSPDRPNWIKDTSESWTVFLNLTIPIFSGFRSLADRASYREDVFLAERELAGRRIEIQRSLAKSMVTITREFNRLKLTQVSAAGARRAMDVALRDYRNGLLSSLDVLNIQRTRFDADKQFAEAQFSYQLQVLQLRRDLGTDLEKTYAALK
jgi:outer membrane protein